MVEYVISSIADKLQALEKYDSAKCDLLIYDNTPTVAPDFTLVAESLRLKLSANPLRISNDRTFGIISVIRDPWLIYDIGEA